KMLPTLSSVTDAFFQVSLSCHTSLPLGMDPVWGDAAPLLSWATYQGSRPGHLFLLHLPPAPLISIPPVTFVGFRLCFRLELSLHGKGEKASDDAHVCLPKCRHCSIQIDPPAWLPGPVGYSPAPLERIYPAPALHDDSGAATSRSEIYPSPRRHT